jgi:hypothetical protein
LQKWGKMATTKIPTWEEESGTRFYYRHHIPLVLRLQSSQVCKARKAVTVATYTGSLLAACCFVGLTFS